MPENWKKPFEVGVKAFREKKYEVAIKFFTQSIALDDGNACVFDSRAAAYEQVKRLREALLDTRKCIALQPDRYISYFRSARIFHTLHKYDRCLQMLEAARKRLNPAEASYQRRIEDLAQLEISAREELVKAEERRRARVDPLGKLPVEILVEICKLVINDSDLELGPRRVFHFAVALGAVCRSLRELVHSTPSLWQTIALSDRYLGRKAAFWLDRLDGQPLYSVTLFDIGLASIPKLQKFLAATRPESWKHLYIEDSDTAACELYRILQSYHMQLYSFNIKCPPQVSDTPSAGIYDPEDILKYIAPVPETQEPGTFTRSMSLHVGSVNVTCATLPYITHLELCVNRFSSFQTEPLFYLLHAAPNLRSLTIRAQHTFISTQHMSSTPIPDPKDTPVLRLPSLEVLRLGTIGPVQPSIILQLPNLQVLDLQQLSISKPPVLLKYLIDCAPEDRPPIRELRINRTNIVPDRLKQALRAFSDTLESLEFTHCSAIEQDIYESLSRPMDGASGPLLCPRLRDINFSGTDDLRAGPLVRMIKARSPSANAGHPDPPTPIRNLIIDSCPNVDAEALPWMRANVTGNVSCVYKTRAEAKGRRRDRYL